MKKEFGKWLMDIAKYVATGVLIASLVGEVKEKWLLMLYGVLTTVLCLIIGLVFINKEEK